MRSATVLTTMAVGDGTTPLYQVVARELGYRLRTETIEVRLQAARRI
jgi:hypothetical protein